MSQGNLTGPVDGSYAKILGIVIAGSPHEPMTRAMAADLERRGYIVYVTVSSADEEHIVQSESRADIKPLWLDLTTVSLLGRRRDS